MTQHLIPLSKDDLRICDITRAEDHWLIDAKSQLAPLCPACLLVSTSRHSHYTRVLRDLPVQGIPVRVRVASGRWRCRNSQCERRIFTERLPRVALPHARWTCRLAEILRVFGHGTGGRPAERLLSRLGMVASDNTILRHLKGSRPVPAVVRPPRVIGIDDWAWTKGQNYGTIMVDLETRTVVDVLADRSSTSVARWLDCRPGIEIICRDRHGLYAEGSRLGAPEARQVADRFHLIDNLRCRLEQQISRQHKPIRRPKDKLPVETVERAEEASKPDPRTTLQAQFAQVRTLYGMGRPVADIVRTSGLSRKRVDKWVRLEKLPERNLAASKPTHPAHYHAFLAQRWAEDATKIVVLHDEIRRLGYTGCRSRLAEYLSPWRRGAGSKDETAVGLLLPVDPTSGARISSLVAASLCMKPPPLLTRRQLTTLDLLKEEVPGFRTMRRLALRFRALLRSRKPEKLAGWIADATKSGIYALQRFAKTLRRDSDAVKNAIAEPWSSGQTEGQINRLKMLKRSMYGRASTELLPIRMLPLSHVLQHQL
jgi:transposase